MKMILIAMICLSSFSAFSKVEFIVKRDSETCVVKDNKVTISHNLKNAPLEFSTTQDLTTKGVEELAVKAARSSTGRTIEGLDYTYDVIIDGVKSSLYNDDSKESYYLVTFLNKVCK